MFCVREGSKPSRCNAYSIACNWMLPDQDAMPDLAIRVENPCPEPGRRISKLYPELSARAGPELSARAGHLGALQQRHDTTSPSLSASLRDALTGMFRRGHQSTNPQSTNSHSDELWALRDVSFEACPEGR